jgi:hypothetical protein
LSFHRISHYWHFSQTSSTGVKSDWESDWKVAGKNSLVKNSWVDAIDAKTEVPAQKAMA